MTSKGNPQLSLHKTEGQETTAGHRDAEGIGGAGPQSALQARAPLLSSEGQLQDPQLPNVKIKPQEESRSHLFPL